MKPRRAGWRLRHRFLQWSRQFYLKIRRGSQEGFVNEFTEWF